MPANQSRDTSLPPRSRKALAILFLFSGCFFGYFGIDNIGLSIASITWPTVRGTVVSSQVQSKRAQETPGGRYEMQHIPSGLVYQAHIQYRYTVSGIPYMGSRVNYGDVATSDPGRSRRITARYPAGAGVIVHYRRDSPEESVLETGLHLGSSIFPILALGFFGVSILAWPKKQRAT